MVKVIELKISVPEWIEEEDIHRRVKDIVEHLSNRDPADKLRIILEVVKITWNMEIPENY